MNVAIIVLAAGKSSRMGFPKQLISINGKSLIKNILLNVLDTKCYPITVVLGANKPQIVPELIDAPITLIDNANWEKGMGSSIKMGLVGTYMVEKNIEAIVVMTVDMPFVNDKIINELIEKAADEHIEIVASKYEKTLGVPALFKRSVFEDILTMSDTDGAKNLILKNKATTAWIEFPEGKYDLDTPEDVKLYLSMN